MNNKTTTPTSKMVATKSKNKVLSCSTPEHRSESPSRDSDSICDSEAASPVPFLCTQDGTEGEIDVVWNFYTPKSDHAPTSRLKNSTPLSRKARKSIKPKLIEKPIPKRRTLRTSQKKAELFQDLLELNQNLQELIAKKSKSNIISEKPHSGSEDDIFNVSGESSPKSGLRTNSHCLRRNVLSSKFSKPESETALESDDSMNECLIKASQVVEENIINYEPRPAKRTCHDKGLPKSVANINSDVKFKMDHDSMDAILNSIKLESPAVSRTKKCESPRINNDSFDNFMGNLNDSALDRLTQMPVNKNSSNNLNTSNVDWTIQDIVVHDCSPSSKTLFGRHNSMPESPSVTNLNRPSTSGMVFGRYSSMPYDKNASKVPGDSPIRCTPEEIKKKHQVAREKLLAKRQLPFTQQSSQVLPTLCTQQPATKKPVFRPRVASSVTTTTSVQSNIPMIQKKDPQPTSRSETVDLKLLIEKKRQEALMKLRKRQLPNKP